MSKLKSIDTCEIQNALDISDSWADLRIKLYGSPTSGSAHKQLKKFILSSDFDLTKFEDNIRNRKKQGISKKESNGSSWCSVKRRFKETTEYKCVECGITDTWNGKPITLQVDHIDGNNSNNDFGNLRYLCPNCHTQTHTWGGKLRSDIHKKRCGCGVIIHNKTNKCMACYSLSCYGMNRKVERPSKETLLSLLETNTYVDVGKMYNVSDNAIRKWVKLYNKYE